MPRQMGGTSSWVRCPSREEVSSWSQDRNLTIPLPAPSLKELESQVSCLEKETSELKEAMEQQKGKNNVSRRGRGACGPGLPKSSEDTL